MRTSHWDSLARPLAIATVAALLGGCAADAPVAPDGPSVTAAGVAASSRAASPAAETHRTLATIRRATARHHDLDAAIADGFVFLHGCETRPGEGPVGIVYVHLDRLMDGAIDPAAPDALIYAPRRDGRPKLVGVEMAVPYALWTRQAPPTFLGATFQREDEFGVFGLHVWVWGDNPEGLFAESNPRVRCGEG